MTSSHVYVLTGTSCLVCFVCFGFFLVVQVLNFSALQNMCAQLNHTTVLKEVPWFNLDLFLARAFKCFNQRGGLLHAFSQLQSTNGGVGREKDWSWSSRRFAAYKDQLPFAVNPLAWGKLVKMKDSASLGRLLQHFIRVDCHEEQLRDRPVHFHHPLSHPARSETESSPQVRPLPYICIDIVKGAMTQWPHP